MIHRATIPVLTVLLLVGSVGSASAQTDANREPTALLFVVVMDQSGDGSGRFTPFSEFDGGSVEIIEDLTDNGSIERILRLDPAPPGGDTFDIRSMGRAFELRDAVGLQMIELRWDILGGTGTLGDLIGGGNVLSALQPDEAPRISVYGGSVARAVAGSELARQNWEAIQKRFKIKKLNKRGRDATFTQASQTKPLRKLAKQNRGDVAFLTELGSQDCYAEAYDALLGLLNDLDRGLELKMGFDPDADGLIFRAQTRLEAFDRASDLVRC